MSNILTKSLAKLSIGLAFLIVGSIILFAFMNTEVAILGAICAIIGLVSCIFAAIQVRKDVNTEKYGVERYGIVTALSPTNTRINGSPVWAATVLLVDDYGQFKTLKNDVGIKPEYRVGDYVRVKHLDENINIDGKVGKDEVPFLLKEELDRGYRSSIHAEKPVDETPFEDQYKI